LYCIVLYCIVLYCIVLYCIVLVLFPEHSLSYALVLFYVAAKEELEKHRPIAKFLSVKAILFFTFWQVLHKNSKLFPSVFMCFVCLQSIAIAVLSHVGVLTDIGSWSQHEIAVLLQDLAICCEMFLLAVFHSTHTIVAKYFSFDLFLFCFQFSRLSISAIATRRCRLSQHSSLFAR
jgi:hypothetical protein